MVGLLTRTVIHSPVVRWILQARIRKRSSNDVVFVGDDFVHVKQIKEYGHLEHVATKANFDARIRAATTFTIGLFAEEEDLFTKLEGGKSADASQDSPSQLLVLTLDSNDLLFVYLRVDGDRAWRFVHQTCPLPRFDRTLFQLGEYLAVDPHSRALAVAASEREIVIYATKAGADVSSTLRSRDSDWSPIYAQRPLQVDGVIQHMDFLRPAVDDDDHIVLLLIIIERKRTRALWIDWYADSDLHKAQIHSGQPLDVGNHPSSLLIPLRDTSFLIASGSRLIRWTDILCGPAVGVEVPVLDTAPLLPGASPRKPLWVNWCRPRRVQARNDNVDHLYLMREDGNVLLLEAGANDVISSHAGDFGCHVGSAFASVGGLRDPDILVAAGDMSNGRIYSIGHWSTPITVAEMSRADTMLMDLVETLPIWASVTDMVTSTLPGKSQRSRDGIFVTSGRQPHGAVTELRYGLEARLSVYFELEGLRGVTSIWALPLASVGRMLMILTTPSGTRLLDVSSDAEMQNIEEVDESAVALDVGSQTLAAAATADGRLIQVTRRSIAVSPGLSANFEDVLRIQCSDTTIVAANIDPERPLIVTAERSTSLPSDFSVKCYALQHTDANGMDPSTTATRTAQIVEDEPLCLACLNHGTDTIAFTATSRGNMHALAIQQDCTFTTLATRSIPNLQDGDSICDNMAIICHRSSNEDNNPRFLLLCGLRDGRLYMVNIDLVSNSMFGDDAIVDFGRSSVKLTQPSHDAPVAYATSGIDTCLLCWDGGSPSSLKVHSIWISDKLRPELAQGPVVACTRMPAAHLLSSPDLAEALVLISGDEFLVTMLDRTPATVPRQIPVSGTPNRLIYAEQQRCLVCASLQYDVQYFPSALPHSKPEERRQIWPVIDFIPSRGSEPSFSYNMQPGEKVYGLLEWSFKLGPDKTYSFILVAGSYTKSSGSIRGRITFLQPVNKNWEVVDVKEGRKANFDAPVYALTLLDDITYAACVGSHIVISRFSIDERKWEQICPPFRLSSPGVYITATSEGAIFISTAEDSFVTLDIVKTSGSPEQANTDPGFKYQLRYRSSAPRADALLSHAVPDIPGTCLATTKYGRVLGLQPFLQDTLGNEARLVFEACLYRSLTRIRRCNVRPPWKPKPKPIAGSSSYELIGCAPDGSLVGLLLIEDDLMHRLSWLQRLCEWSEELSPHSYRSPAYTVSEQTYAENERAMPIGLGSRVQDRGEIVMRTSRNRLNDKHIDGDVLARLVQNDAAETLRRMLREAVQKDDRTGEWMRQHLNQELAAVDEIIAIVQNLLDGWL